MNNVYVMLMFFMKFHVCLIYVVWVAIKFAWILLYVSCTYFSQMCMDYDNLYVVLYVFFCLLTNNDFDEMSMISIDLEWIACNVDEFARFWSYWEQCAWIMMNLYVVLYFLFVFYWFCWNLINFNIFWMIFTWFWWICWILVILGTERLKRAKRAKHPKKSKTSKIDLSP